MWLTHYGQLNDGVILQPAITGYECYGINKPRGENLLYTSPREGYYGWKEWVMDDKMEARIANQPKWHLETEAHPKIMQVRSQEELQSVLQLFPGQIPDKERLSIDLDSILSVPILDWVKMAQLYQLIWVNHVMTGWNCETIMVMDAQCIKQVIRVR